MTTKQEYQESLNRMEEAYYSSDNSMDAMIRFKEDINLITELVNENVKENIRNIKTELTKEDTTLVMSHGIVVQLL